MMGTYFLDTIFSERIKEEGKTQIDLWQLILIVDFRSVIQNPWMHLRELKHFEKEKEEYCMAATEISVDISTGGKIVAIKL
jgi:hypothetical protein